MPIYLLRQVLTLAVKLVRSLSELIFFPILNRQWLTAVHAAGSIEIAMYSLLAQPLPLYCPFSTAEPDYLMDPFAAFLDCVDH